MSMIDQIIDFNKSFVAQKDYEKYLTDKYPERSWRCFRVWTLD